MTESPRLVGPNITLRALGPDDAQPLFEQASDEAVTRFLTWDCPQAVQEIEKFIIESLQRQSQLPGTCHQFCIVLNETNEPIGCTALEHIDLQHRHATVGSWIGSAHWGFGHMRETKALILDHAFGPLGLQRVQAYTDLDNQRSIGSLESCGFRREGVARRHMLKGGEFHCQVVMAILAGEHRALVHRALGREPQKSTLQI